MLDERHWKISQGNIAVGRWSYILGSDSFQKAANEHLIDHKFVLGPLISPSNLSETMAPEKFFSAKMK